jgi:hypothetical protein
MKIDSDSDSNIRLRSQVAILWTSNLLDDEIVIAL